MEKPDLDQHQYPELFSVTYINTKEYSIMVMSQAETVVVDSHC